MRLSQATDGRKVLRLGTGLEIRLGNLAAAAVLAAAALILFAVALMLGTTAIGPGDLLAVLTGRPLGADQAFALETVRLPPLLTGFMAGWGIGLAGAMLQSLSRNPLADPGLLGLNQGAVVVTMLLLIAAPAAPAWLMPLAAAAGSLGVALALLWLVGGSHSEGLTILLAGIAVEALLSAVSSIMLLYTPPESSYALSEWMAGSLFRADWASTRLLALWFGIGLLATLLCGPATSNLDLGDDMAMSLGENVRVSKPAILLFAVFVSSAAVTAVGPLTFLGVLAPHLATFLSPASGRARLILSGLAGGTLVLAAECLTKSVPTGMAMPTGLALTLVGVPLFILSLRLRLLLAAR